MKIVYQKKYIYHASRYYLTILRGMIHTPNLSLPCPRTYLEIDGPGHRQLSGIVLFEESFLLLVLPGEDSPRKNWPVHPALHHPGHVGHQEHPPVQLELPMEHVGKCVKTRR